MELARIGQRDDLSVRLQKELARIVLTLTTTAHNRDVHFLAGRYKLWPAQDMAWDDGQSCERGGGSAKELTAIESFF